MFDRFKEKNLLKSRGKQRTDSTHILASIRVLNRLELVGETLNHALNVLAEVAPNWLQQQITRNGLSAMGNELIMPVCPMTKQSVPN